MTSMELSEGRGMGASTVPGTDEKMERALAYIGWWASQRHGSGGYGLLSL